jgi:hypothetical protein
MSKRSIFSKLADAAHYTVLAGLTSLFVFQGYQMYTNIGIGMTNQSNPNKDYLDQVKEQVRANREKTETINQQIDFYSKNEDGTSKDNFQPVLPNDPTYRGRKVPKAQ